MQSIRLHLALFGTSVLAKNSEIHSYDMFRGKGACKGRKIEDRIQVLKELIKILSDERVYKFLVKINVQAHKSKYQDPMPEYNLGLMLLRVLKEDR